MPLSWRKFALTVSRVQSSPISNQRLQLQLEDLYITDDVTLVNPVTGLMYTLSDLCTSTDYYSSSPILCSIASYMVRAELVSAEIAETVKYDGIMKEIHAALSPDIPQQLDYRGLTVSSVTSLHGNSVGGNTLQAWRRGIDNLKTIFRQQAHIFIPHYNRRKNISWTSQQNLSNSRSGVGFSSLSDMHTITQRDVMIYYHETGERIRGPMEMRFAWRYNDLKGRTYYCTGGDAIWAGLYIKGIAKDLLNLLPSTHTRARYDSRRVTGRRGIRQGEVIITYDYSSFTTSLAELKYFLTYLARQLEGVSFRALDLYEGIIELDLGDYIHSYNETINHNAAFDVSRLDLTELAFELHQVKSGMLGAQGNIAFSTLLHGLSVSGISDDPGQSCVVGDDALLRIWMSIIAQAISLVNKLGAIERSKTHIFEPSTMYDYDENEIRANQSWQFLKRPFNIDESGLVITGELPIFPSLAEMLMPEDGYHRSQRDRSRFKRFIRFAKEWGSFLTRLSLHSIDVNHDEVELILSPIQEIYTKFGVPHEGLPIGHYLDCGGRDGSGNSPIIIPPCSNRVFTEDWVDLHCEIYRGTTVWIPMQVDFSIPPGPCYGPGHRIERCTVHRIQRVMVDLGYFLMENCMRCIELGVETRQDIKALVYGTGMRTVHTIICIRQPPEWYNAIIYDEGPE